MELSSRICSVPPLSPTASISCLDVSSHTGVYGGDCHWGDILCKWQLMWPIHEIPDINISISFGDKKHSWSGWGQHPSSQRYWGAAGLHQSITLAPPPFTVQRSTHPLRGECLWRRETAPHSTPDHSDHWSAAWGERQLFSHSLSLYLVSSLHTQSHHPRSQHSNSLNRPSFFGFFGLLTLLSTLLIFIWNFLACLLYADSCSWEITRSIWARKGDLDKGFPCEVEVSSSTPVACAFRSCAVSSLWGNGDFLDSGFGTFQSHEALS